MSVHISLNVCEVLVRNGSVKNFVGIRIDGAVTMMQIAPSKILYRHLQSDIAFKTYVIETEILCI